MSIGGNENNFSCLMSPTNLFGANDRLYDSIQCSFQIVRVPRHQAVIYLKFITLFNSDPNFASQPRNDMFDTLVMNR